MNRLFVDKNKLLLDAACSGKINDVKSLLEKKGTDVNHQIKDYKDPEGFTWPDGTVNLLISCLVFDNIFLDCINSCCK